MSRPDIVDYGITPNQPDVVLMGNQPAAKAITINNELVNVVGPAETPAPRVKRPYNRKPRLDEAQEETA